MSALLAAGADPNIRGDYGTCKDVAIAAGHNHLIAIIDSTSWTCTQTFCIAPPRSQPHSWQHGT